MTQINQRKLVPTLQTFYQEMKQRQKDHQDALDALSEDIEDNAVRSALDNLSELKDDLREMADRIEQFLVALES